MIAMRDLSGLDRRALQGLVWNGFCLSLFGNNSIFDGVQIEHSRR
jgi:hypothetical protein